MQTRLLCCSGSLEGGGSERQLWQLATEINQEQYVPHIYLLHRRGVYLDRVPDNIPVLSFEPLTSSGFYFPGRTHRAQVDDLSDKIHECGIELVYDRTFHMTLVSAPACRRRRVPRVSTIVSPPSRDFQSSQERFSFFKKRLLARAYADPHSVPVAVSQEVAEDAARFYRIEKDRIEVLPSPVDIHGVTNAAQERAFDRNADIHIAVVGRMSAEKGQRQAIEALAFAVATLREDAAQVNLHMDLVGDGPDRAALEELGRELGVENHLTFHGFLQNPYPLIARSDVLLVPSQYEGLPNVALEAMVLRTPVVATQCSGALVELLGGNVRAIAQVDETARGKLVAVDRPEDMAKALVEYATHPEIGERHAENARRYVTQHHSLSAWLKRMDEIFQRLLPPAGRHQ